ncbi:site-specific integrase [Ruminococcus sp. XPD3002]|uniref:tyrosine-type recombinase/integrase n=1 Tax=Ruminococcus sp. XPD3002 TaxID=1452269 RepID=UPI00090FFD52|nr:Site-specific recombinase XerD [Ruminococcus flavefaciens]
MNIKICLKSDREDSKDAVTIEEYILNWLNTVKINELKPTSFDRKEQTIQYQILPYIGKIRLSDLKSEDIQFMINDLKGKYSYSTIKKAYECINSCLKYAVKRHDVSFNAAEGCTIPKALMNGSDDKIKFFSDEEMKRIECEAVRCYKNGNRIYRMGEIIIFLVNTGMRIGEALALEWSDINFDSGTVQIRKNVVLVKDRDENRGKSYKYIKQNPKTRSGSRIVPLNKAATQALISLRGINGKFKYVFATKTGKRIHPRSIDRMFRCILKKSGLEGVGVHSLRHTFASRLFAKGVDVKTVSDLLGHSEVGVTYDTYIHLIQEQHVIAVETLENVLL